MTETDIIKKFEFKKEKESEYKLFIKKAEELNVFKACGNLDNMWVMCRFNSIKHMEQFIFSLSTQSIHARK